MFNLPMSQSQASGPGKTATTPIPISGIKSGDVLLGVAKWKGAEIADGVNPNDFTVADGTITHATVDLSTYQIAAIWTHG